MHEVWLREKIAVQNVVGDLVATVLWEPRVASGEAYTELHHIKVWKEEGCVKAEVRKVR